MYWPAGLFVNESDFKQTKSLDIDYWLFNIDYLITGNGNDVDVTNMLLNLHFDKLTALSPVKFKSDQQKYQWTR